MKIEEFMESCHKIGIQLTAIQIEQFQTYCSFLQEYNTHTNLTAIKDTEAIYLKHFYDSALVSKYMDFQKDLQVLDIGTGAGFPGVVLKILYPQLKITLLDSNHKKTDFLKSLVEKLGLESVAIINERAEDYCKKSRSSFDLVVSRAVADLRVLAELSIPFLKVGGIFLSLKGDAEAELKNSEETITVLNGKVVRIEMTTLPVENSKRTFIFVQKEKETPEIYPRSYDKILKNPLKKAKK